MGPHQMPCPVSSRLDASGASSAAEAIAAGATDAEAASAEASGSESGSPWPKAVLS